MIWKCNQLFLINSIQIWWLGEITVKWSINEAERRLIWLIEILWWRFSGWISSRSRLALSRIFFEFLEYSKWILWIGWKVLQMIKERKGELTLNHRKEKYTYLLPHPLYWLLKIMNLTCLLFLLFLDNTIINLLLDFPFNLSD